MTIDVLGIDLAKNVFQLHGVDRKGHPVFRRRVMRDQLLSVLAGIEPCTIAIEACTGAFCWARKFEALGHKVKIVSPQYVKPFVRRQKNDNNDAEAICTAVRQPHIPLVPKKTVEQQDVQALHRARQRMVNHRTAVVSQIRGLLLDRGIAFGKSITRARRMIPEILANPDNELTAMAREAIGELWDLFCDLDRRIAIFDAKIAAVFKSSAVCQRIARIKGVGPKTATAIVAAVGDGAEFKNGRHMAAWLGLVPRQHSSGDRQIMMGISKRGSQHLRSLLVHGARAVVRTAGTRNDPMNQWVTQLQERRGFNRATVAVANKNARIIWAVLRTGEPYRPAA
ncbi:MULTISPECIES: IS110 family transposase [Acidiphilium]|uniref:Transposase IS116/IS110/IS902 family protein n=1 Tax=Acidiphilium cryptum (strain JF-5) TaxID=349163 RepID=A5FT14_ACICJ|nr:MULTISPECIES: IS110 family transposase [Acidiphilium]ABQ28746.1 transposase IS116/IS110/IS902 family protein [Acidiphilium cryptum JF-5]OYV54342.1 MAG: IS110 family transposase [Acidiphilium sp. 20-67-58]HQT61405.1 IS110 family transposase [Acidiphilium sp.]HQU10146.1 IS110 family transposase [Acidiphilium sp.]